jgi:hypothetical protein
MVTLIVVTAKNIEFHNGTPTFNIAIKLAEGT